MDTCICITSATSGDIVFLRCKITCTRTVFGLTYACRQMSFASAGSVLNAAFEVQAPAMSIVHLLPPFIPPLLLSPSLFSQIHSLFRSLCLLSVPENSTFSRLQRSMFTPEICEIYHVSTLVLSIRNYDGLWNVVLTIMVPRGGTVDGFSVTSWHTWTIFHELKLKFVASKGRILVTSSACPWRHYQLNGHWMDLHTKCAIKFYDT